MKYKTSKERLQDLKNFVEVNNRLPNKLSKDPIEKSLENWISKYGKKKFPEVQEIWDKFEHLKTSEERIQELRKFVEVNNRLPSQRSKDPIEKSLGAWMSNRKKTSPEVQKIYDKYKYYKTPEERIQELRKFIEVNNRLPSQYSKDPIEKSLGCWIDTHGKKKFSEVQEIWDSFKHPKKPGERFLEFKEWVIKNNRLPSEGSSSDSTERFLGHWMGSYKNKIPEVQEIWNKFEHRKTSEERLPEFREWVIKNNRLPRQGSKDPIEKSLGRWRSKHKDWDILKQFIAIFKFKEEYPDLWELEISEA